MTPSKKLRNDIKLILLPSGKSLSKIDDYLRVIGFVCFLKDTADTSYNQLKNTKKILTWLKNNSSVLDKNDYILMNKKEIQNFIKFFEKNFTIK
jgi:hypothetical protein